MRSDSSLSLHYAFDIGDGGYTELAQLQVDAIRQRNAQDNLADYKTDIDLTEEHVADFFESTYDDYEVVIVYGQTASGARTPIAYGAVAPSEKDTNAYILDQLYALRETSIDGTHYNLKKLELGHNVIDMLEENIADVADTLLAKPLEGSERFYHSNGFRKDGNSHLLAKTIRKQEYA